jgi:uncharacterized protein
MTKETRNLILFFTATFLATYTAYFTIVLAGWSPFAMPGLACLLVGGSAPTWVSLLLVGFACERSERAAFFKRLRPGLIGARWWVVIVFIFPLVYALVLAVDTLAGGRLQGMDGLKTYLAQPGVIPLALVFAIVQAPIPEEFGWRGFALDPLMRRFGVIPGTILLGLLWGVWHLGLFFMPQMWHGQMGFRFAGFPTFIILSIGLALVMTWVHRNTGGSILAAILLHTFSNFSASALAPQPDGVEILRALVLLGVGLSLCLAMERRAQRQPAPAL